MKKIIILAIISIFLFNCSSNVPEVENTIIPEPVVPEVNNTVISEPVVPEVIEEVIVEPESEPEPCVLSDRQQDLASITLDLEDYNANTLRVTDEGFILNFYLFDISGTKLIPSEGNLAVRLFATEVKGNGDIEPTEMVYSKSFYIKESSYQPGCVSNDFFISFDDIINSDNYDKYVSEGEMGFLKVIFTRSGSKTVFETEYDPNLYNIDLLR